MELLEKISNILQIYDELEKEIDELDDMCEKIPEEQSNVDKLLSDYYHIIENEELSNEAMVNICKKIHDARKIRREFDMKNTLISTYKKNKNKLMISPRATRGMFRNSLSQAVKSFPTKYNFRILSEEDVKNIVGEKKSKEDMLEDLKNNQYTKKEIAEKYGVSQALVYYYAKKIKE